LTLCSVLPMSVGACRIHQQPATNQQTGDQSDEEKDVIYVYMFL
jgi:hypothetical protein